MVESALRGFWFAAESQPERLALIDVDGRALSAGELAAASNQLANTLLARGVGAGSVVAVLAPNGRMVLEVLLAAMQSGWHYTPINTHLTESEVAHILRDSAADALFAHESTAALARASARVAGLGTDRCYCESGGEGFVSLEGLRRGQPESRPEERLAGQFMQYTSGTTGRPKAVRREIPPMDPDAMIAMLAPNLSRYDIEPGSGHVHLVTSPMYHMAPLSFAYFSAHFEHTIVLMEHWDAVGALELIQQHRITTTHMVPTQFQRLMRLPADTRAAYDVSSLRHVMHAAAPCPVELKRRMLEWWGPVIYEYYGATEGGGTMVRPTEWLERPGTVGRPWPGADVRILDDAGQPCPPGTIGTVYLKLLMDFEYKDDPDKTREARRDGYFSVGDMGELDADGYLYLRDRKIDMIISGGVNLYPAEIEAVLLAHPKVGDAAVFGIPHDDWGEQVMAVVEPVPGVVAGAALAAELSAHCERRLARFKCPRSIEFTTALPRDPNGKLYKRKLRDPFWHAERRRI